jgi:hypothetical protein
MGNARIEICKFFVFFTHNVWLAFAHTFPRVRMLAALQRGHRQRPLALRENIGGLLVGGRVGMGRAGRQPAGRGCWEKLNKTIVKCDCQKLIIIKIGYLVLFDRMRTPLLLLVWIHVFKRLNLNIKKCKLNANYQKNEIEKFL